jgi:hypothetical protein
MDVNMFISSWILMDHSSNGSKCVTTPVATEITAAMGW